jgi:hypothetical protein
MTAKDGHGPTFLPSWSSSTIAYFGPVAMLRLRLLDGQKSRTISASPLS